MQKTILLTAAAVAIVCISGYWLIASNVTFAPVLPRDVPRGTTEEELQKLFEASLEEDRPSAVPGSVAEVQNASYEFGVLDPFMEQTHYFEIRNAGTEPLRLGEPESDMPYNTTLRLDRREVAPGETARLAFTFADSAERAFRSVGTVPTSDPDNPLVRFTVKGKIAHRVQASARGVDFGGRALHESFSDKSVLVYSKLWKQFELESVSSDFQDVVVQTRPATQAELQKHDALGGYVVEVAIPSFEPKHGEFGATVTLAVQPPTERDGQPFNFQIPVRWKLYRPLAVYGDAVNGYGVIDVGHVTKGYAASVTLNIKVRDIEKQLPNARVEVTPSYVRGTIQPSKTGGEGSYVLQIHVPDDAPCGSHLRLEEMGQVRLLSDHPRIGEERLKLRFAVVKPNLNNPSP